MGVCQGEGRLGVGVGGGPSLLYLGGIFSLVPSPPLFGFGAAASFWIWCRGQLVWPGGRASASLGEPRRRRLLLLRLLLAAARRFVTRAQSMLYGLTWCGVVWCAQPCVRGTEGAHPPRLVFFGALARQRGRRQAGGPPRTLWAPPPAGCCCCCCWWSLPACRSRGGCPWHGPLLPFVHTAAAAVWANFGQSPPSPPPPSQLRGSVSTQRGSLGAGPFAAPGGPPLEVTGAACAATCV